MNSMQALDFDMRKYGFDSQLYAYISIPAIKLQLPIYTNVTSKTLANGAARLSSTSLPIGGENTNCVLAGHSGYQNPLFTNITKLKAGDTITIWNLWEELTYEVVSTKKILPTDIDSVMIQEGKDMVTLMTCTPVHVNTYRYLVYCERVTE
jgi:sortase A